MIHCSALSVMGLPTLIQSPRRTLVDIAHPCPEKSMHEHAPWAHVRFLCSTHSSGRQGQRAICRTSGRGLLSIPNVPYYTNHRNLCQVPGLKTFEVRNVLPNDHTFHIGLLESPYIIPLAQLQQGPVDDLSALPSESEGSISRAPFATC